MAIARFTKLLSGLNSLPATNGQMLRTGRYAQASYQAVATMFTNANLFWTEAEQHQTLRMPSIATGTSDDNRSARRLRVAGVLIPLIPTK
jgi:hypothetical protein